MNDLTSEKITRESAESSTEDKRRNAIKGAFFSEFIDMFDIYLPVVILAPVLAYFQSPHLSARSQEILDSLVYITTLLGRPIGSLIFGIVADRIGRRMASIWSVSGFGIVTFLIALLPGYESIGDLSYFLLVFLRFIDGVFLGGGYTGALPLAIEYSKKRQRGFTGGFILAGFPAAYVSITLVGMLMFHLTPLNGMHSSYAEVGWRIPFVIGALLAGLLAIFYITKVSESEVWNSEVENRKLKGKAAKKMPLVSLLRGPGGRSLLQVLVMMTGFYMTENLMAIFLPTGVLIGALHLSGFELTLTLMITFSMVFFSFIGSGMLGQRVGRRRFFTIVGPLIATVGAYLLHVLIHARGMPLPSIIAITCVLAMLVTSPWGVIVTYLSERFDTDVRATGFGIGVSLSVVIPSFYAFYMNWLSAFMPQESTSVVLLCLGGLLGAFGASIGPETNDVDF
jgi:MFS family permease